MAKPPGSCLLRASPPSTWRAFHMTVPLLGDPQSSGGEPDCWRRRRQLRVSHLGCLGGERLCFRTAPSCHAVQPCARRFRAVPMHDNRTVPAAKTMAWPVLVASVSGVEGGVG